MKYRLVIAAVAQLAACVAALPAAADAPPRALVIGNAAYASLPPLPACTASANTVSSALSRAGFSVTVRKDLSNGQMGAAINDFADAPGAAALVYICGYAAGYEGRMFLLPVPAQMQRATDALTEGVLARFVARSMDERPGTNLVLLDSAAMPDAASPPTLATAFPADREPSTGFAAAYGAMSGNAASSMAMGIVSALMPATVTTADVMAGIRTALRQTPGTDYQVLAPGDAWIIKGAAKPPDAPPAPPPAAAAPAADPGAITLAAPGPARLRQIQAALKTLGYYDGGVDGLPGAETLAAIRRYQHELHAAMTGQLTDDQARHLLITAH